MSSRMHRVKSWSHFFDSIVTGQKKHDMRDMKDRDYKVGDVLRLERYDNIKGEYTGETCLVEITYITSRDTPCAFSSAALDREFCILSLQLLDDLTVPSWDGDLDNVDTTAEIHNG